MNDVIIREAADSDFEQIYMFKAPVSVVSMLAPESVPQYF